jgi:sugar phosphate isomerase/epimerase
MQSKHSTDLKLGVTLFAFTNEWHAREYNLEQLIARVAERKLGPGLEVIGFQSFRGFPYISDDTAARFKDVVAQHGLTQSCLGLNADTALRRGTLMGIDEQVA